MEFGKLQSFVELDLSNCSKLGRLLDSIVNLSQLKTFPLSSCQKLENLPVESRKPQSLVELDLSNYSKLWCLLDSIVNLSQLKTFRLSSCQKLENLPVEFGKLQSLVELDLSNCFELRCLPDSIVDLSQLKTFQLSSCQNLENLPVDFGELQSLMELDLSNCSKLRCLPDSIVNLSQLKTFRLSSCQKLENLPVESGKLQSLVELDISNCSELRCLPHSIVNFPQLKTFQLSICQKLENLPVDFGELQSLVELDLSNCSELWCLPDSIVNLSQLKTFRLSSCQKLENLPVEFGKLQSLVELNISNCSELRCLPDSIVDLSQLKTFQLSSCQNLKNLPVDFGEFQSWVSLVELHFKMCALQMKIRKILGFLLVVLFIYQYLMGYVERGQWNTYSNGAWEFRATYVCIELRLGSYPFQKFRETPRRFGVRPKNKNGVTVKYEPWVWFRKRKIYFEVQKTEDKAARIRDVAKYWLKSEGRDPLNFGEEDYYYLNFVQEFHPQQSDNEHEENHKIRRLVLEHAQPFLKEVQEPQVPIVDQPPFVEPARFANGEHIENPIQEFLPCDSDQVDNMFQELYQPVDADHQQTMDMTEEPQSVFANSEFAGATIEENIREHREALRSACPSFIQSGCTSQITLIAPCDGTGAVNLFTELKVFREENWNAKTGAGATSSCALEGCSAPMHEFAFLQKSAKNQERWPENIWAKLDAFEDHGWQIELLGNGRWGLNSSAGPSFIQSQCTSQITLIPPCDGTGVVNDLFTELKVFRKENWHPITGKGATSSCALEGCLSTVHEFAFLQKSGENQELWPVDIWAKLDAFQDRGWKIELLENGRQAT
ncbi:hypothetical protein BDL97_16G082700 [Sphagnum fallax]|nr:hypothetical protein BDL97_16G082700 [Sphagnum fallax]